MFNLWNSLLGDIVNAGSSGGFKIQQRKIHPALLHPVIAAVSALAAHITGGSGEALHHAGCTPALPTRQGSRDCPLPGTASDRPSVWIATAIPNAFKEPKQVFHKVALKLD